ARGARRSAGAQIRARPRSAVDREETVGATPARRCRWWWGARRRRRNEASESASRETLFCGVRGPRVLARVRRARIGEKQVASIPRVIRERRAQPGLVDGLAVPRPALTRAHVAVDGAVHDVRA